MNLIELSQRTNRSMDDLKEILMIQFNRIILSEYIDLDEEILQKLMGYLNISQTDPAGSQEISDDFMETTDEEQCFKELSDILHPEMKYTRELLEYCSEHNYLFFIDTCSLLNQHFFDFFTVFDAAVSWESSLYIP